jgi:hypothetical protein
MDEGVRLKRVVCETCGRPFEVEAGKRGQPKLYCDDACKDLPVRLRQLDRLLPLVGERMDNVRVRATRSTLQRSANLLNRFMPRTGRYKKASE